MERKIALVTGSSEGIGKAIVTDFAAKGYNVVINYKNDDAKAQKLKEELESIYNIEALTIKTDVSDENEVKNMIKQIISNFGKIDVLVNNAGIAIDKEFDDRTVEDWKLTLNTNLIAPLLLANMLVMKCIKIKEERLSIYRALME